DSDSAEFPPQPEWFRTNADFPNLAEGLRKVGFNDSETDALLGENWLRFFESSFTPRDE
ncbi:MAG: dipeptidase, partial [Alphaproteobacteria bacterium]|nr:dipeptidase [Alphaproteobacteria bacterium]